MAGVRVRGGPEAYRDVVGTFQQHCYWECEELWLDCTSCWLYYIERKGFVQGAAAHWDWAGAAGVLATSSLRQPIPKGGRHKTRLQSRTVAGLLNERCSAAGRVRSAQAANPLAAAPATQKGVRASIHHKYQAPAACTRTPTHPALPRERAGNQRSKQGAKSRQPQAAPGSRVVQTRKTWAVELMD